MINIFLCLSFFQILNNFYVSFVYLFQAFPLLSEIIVGNSLFCALGENIGRPGSFGKLHFRPIYNFIWQIPVIGTAQQILGGPLAILQLPFRRQADERVGSREGRADQPGADRTHFVWYGGVRRRAVERTGGFASLCGPLLSPSPAP